MFDHKQDVKADRGGKASGGDMYDFSTTNLYESVKHSSVIENILLGISKCEVVVTYEKPDTDDYTVEDKIDHNKLTKYKDFFDDYMENYSLVKSKIDLIAEEDLTFERRLIVYVRNKYILYFSRHESADMILEKIISDIEQEMKNYSDLLLEDISSLHYVVFYVFARCKIFEKPPKK